jgi:hypothetical protein
MHKDRLISSENLSSNPLPLPVLAKELWLVFRSLEIPTNTAEERAGNVIKDLKQTLLSHKEYKKYVTLPDTENHTGIKNWSLTFEGKKIILEAKTLQSFVGKGFIIVGDFNNKNLPFLQEAIETCEFKYSSPSISN